MEWQGQRESENVEDRRGMSGPVMAGGGVVGTLIILLLAWIFGFDPRPLLQQQEEARREHPAQVAPGRPAAPGAHDELRKFVAVVLADTEDVWIAQFKKMGKVYREPRLVLFTGQVDSACGQASSAVGPFYCPGDDRVYLDLSFFDELKNRFKAPGEFAQAYVIAHEVGHHVQNLLGISAKVNSQRKSLSKTEYNKLSVRLELQADFLAGVWAHHAQKMKNILQPGDIEAAIKAATAIGDDRLQMQSKGYVVPDAFTHGTSEQRVRWFRKGFDTGDINQGDTFSAEDL
jgi:predicted metalloprotease